MRFLRKFPTFWLILLPMLIPGILVASWRLVFRNLAEKRNVYVETVVDFEEIRQLAREEGLSLKELFKALKQNGASSVAVSEDTLASLESEGKITVLSSKEIRKLAIDESLEIDIPAGTVTLGSLWVHSEQSELLDRIEQNLSWKIARDKLIRIHRNLLLINKSSSGFRERVGLGFSSDYFQLAHESGLGLVVRVFNYPGITASSATRIINSIPSPASVSALLFAEEEMLGVRGELKEIIELFRNRSYRIGWIEFNTQDGIEQYLRQLSASRPFVRVHSISRKEVDEVYNVRRSVARWVRAVKERSMKMLYIRCFFQDDKRFIENLVTFNLAYIKRISAELQKNGYQIADDQQQRFSEPRHLVGKMSQFEIMAVGLSLILGIPLLIRTFCSSEIGEKFCLPVAFSALVMFLILPIKTFIGVSGLIGAVTYSTFGVIGAMKRVSPGQSRFWHEIPGFAARMVVPSILGGILIAGIYSDIEYLLKFEQFRGIKLAFILPLLLTGIWSVHRFGRGIFTLLHKPVNPVGVLLLSLLAAGSALYILRSGNVTFLKPSELEDSIRTFLENSLGARPRNKEFLVGYPAGLLFIYLAARMQLTVLPVLAIFMQMGQVSVVNTMCHFHTPVALSLLRIFNGLWSGLLFGLAAVFFIAIIRLLMLPGREKTADVLLLGYFGRGNVGDELLWQTFACRFIDQIPDGRILLLKSGATLSQKNARIMGISRFDILAVLEALLTCKAVVMPGGSVLQSITSRRSLFYYLCILSFARVAGARIYLLAQGLGPFCEKGIIARGLHYWLANELKLLDYASFRDRESAELFQNLTGNEAMVSADAVFANEAIVPVQKKAISDSVSLMVILRSSVDASMQIATDLLKMNDELENLKLIPASMQLEEDETVWRQAGWQGAIEYLESPETQLSQADIVVSMRLHGCILATQVCIPWLGISYDPKVKAFADSCNWKFCVAPADAQREYLEKKINLLVARREEFSDKLNRIANERRRIAAEDFSRILTALKQ